MITARMDDLQDYAYREYYKIGSLEIGPTGTVFSKPVKLTLFYLPSMVPSNVSETDMVIGMWDSTLGHWTTFQSAVDPISHSVATSVDHLTTFAILAPRSHP